MNQRHQTAFPPSFAKPLKQIADKWRDITGYRPRFEALLAAVHVDEAVDAMTKPARPAPGKVGRPV